MLLPNLFDSINDFLKNLLAMKEITSPQRNDEAVMFRLSPDPSLGVLLLIEDHLALPDQSLLDVMEG